MGPGGRIDRMIWLRLKLYILREGLNVVLIYVWLDRDLLPILQ